MKAKEIPDGVELIYIGLSLVRASYKDGGSLCAFKLKHATDTYRFFSRDKDFDVDVKVLEAVDE
jgi:hypothetical protein